MISKQKKLHTKAIKSKNREIQKLKDDISVINKQKDITQKLSIDIKKERVKTSDLLKQRGRLESQLEYYKQNMADKNTQNIQMAKEISDLKGEVEKYKKLYTNAKSNMTPFSEFKLENATEATQGPKPTPTDLKVDDLRKEKTLANTKNTDLVHLNQNQESLTKIIPKQQIGATPEVEVKFESDHIIDDRNIISNDNSEAKDDENSLQDDNVVDEQLEQIIDSDEDKVTEKNLHPDVNEEDEHTSRALSNTKSDEILKGVEKEASLTPERPLKEPTEESKNEIDRFNNSSSQDVNHGVSKSEAQTPTKSRHDTENDIKLDQRDAVEIPIKVMKRVSIVDIPRDVKTEFRLILQNKKIPYEKIKNIFPDTNRLQLNQLIEHFQSFGRFEDKILLEQVCRYLVENDTQGDIISYNEKADLDMIAIVSKFKNKIVDDDYHIFDEDNEIKKKEIDVLKQEITSLIKPHIISLREALDIEDVNCKGHLTIDQIKNVFKEMEIKISNSQYEYLVYEMYKNSKNSKKLKYNLIFDILDLNNNASIYNQEANFEDVKSDNYDNEFFSEVNEEKSVKQSIEKHKASVGTGNDDHQQEDEQEIIDDMDDDEVSDTKGVQGEDDINMGTSKDNSKTSTDNVNLENQKNQETSNMIDEPNMETQGLENASEQTNRQVHNEGEDDDYIDDEEMIKIAES